MRDFGEIVQRDAHNVPPGFRTSGYERFPRELLPIRWSGMTPPVLETGAKRTGHVTPVPNHMDQFHFWKNPANVRNAQGVPRALLSENLLVRSGLKNAGKRPPKEVDHLRRGIVGGHSMRTVSRARNALPHVVGFKSVQNRFMCGEKLPDDAGPGPRATDDQCDV